MAGDRDRQLEEGRVAIALADIASFATVARHRRDLATFRMLDELSESD